jgi:glycosyltransferase involved in cell wall biosynthesis
MARLRVLIAAPHDAYNPYCRELGAGYVRCGCEVVYGLDAFWAGGTPVDVVHLQWPEYLLFEWMRPDTDKGRVCERIEALKRSGAIVVATIHNDAPRRPGQAWSPYLESVYAACDGFVHHGRRSRTWFDETFPAFAGRPEIVAPHGAYRSFPSEMTRDAARGALGIADDERVIVVFGRWRSLAELEFVVHGVRAARIESKCLLLNGLLPARRVGYVLNAFSLRRALRGLRHVVYGGLLRADEVQIPLRAADVLLVQRTTGLNSGNVPLAFSFGLPVVSADVGVFGDDARRSGNFVFDPESRHGLSRALEEAFSADLRAVASRNLAAARSELDWTAIAATLTAFFADVSAAASAKARAG